MMALTDFLRLSADRRHAELVAEAEAHRLLAVTPEDLTMDRTLVAADTRAADTVLRFTWTRATAEPTLAQERTASAAGCVDEACVEIGAAA
jgi:hypothetical protein